MKTIRTFLGIAIICLIIALSLLIFSIVESPALPSIPSGILALFGAFVFIRFAFWALISALVLVPLYYFGRLFGMIGTKYQTLSLDEKAEVEKKFWESVKFFTALMHHIRDVRKSIR